MSYVTVKDKTLGEQMWDLLERNPENYDVTFSVGLEKKEVKAVKFLLKAASRVFQKEFEDKWEKAVMKDGEGIPLPDVDPTAFQLAVQLLIQDMWSVEALNSLNLSPNALLALLGICRRFEITNAIKNLEKKTKEFLRTVKEFKVTSKFLKLAQQDLAALFSCENIEMEEQDIFECACRWAEHHCSQKGLEATGENMREILGPCLFEIRFPIMSISEFTKVGRCKKNLLKADEKVAIFEFIGLDEEEKSKDEPHTYFKTKPRMLTQPKSRPILTLNLAKNLKVEENKCNVWNRAELRNSIQISNGRIALYGIGFFGPLLEDAHYDASIEIRKYAAESESSMTGKLGKRLFARKQEIFYFMFDTPVVLEPIQDESTWNSSEKYRIYFTVTGPDTLAVDRKLGREGPVEENGIKFRFYWHTGKNCFAEYLYKKL